MQIIYPHFFCLSGIFVPSLLVQHGYTYSERALRPDSTRKKQKRKYNSTNRRERCPSLKAKLALSSVQGPEGPCSLRRFHALRVGNTGGRLWCVKYSKQEDRTAATADATHKLKISDQRAIMSPVSVLLPQNESRTARVFHPSIVQ